jgi:hypothetical protein
MICVGQRTGSTNQEEKMRSFFYEILPYKTINVGEIYNVYKIYNDSVCEDEHIGTYLKRKTAEKFIEYLEALKNDNIPSRIK